MHQLQPCHSAPGEVLASLPADNDSIGAVICKRADQLNASAVVLAKHNKGAIKEFFVGSVTNYVSVCTCAHVCMIVSYERSCKQVYLWRLATL